MVNAIICNVRLGTVVIEHNFTEVVVELLAKKEPSFQKMLLLEQSEARLLVVSYYSFAQTPKNIVLSDLPEASLIR